MQEVTRKWPKSRSKLSGEYLKILASTADEHREITAFLTEKNEEFHAIDPIEVRPQKVVIKGLPISTDIDAIRADLTERGFNVLKVAQLTKAKSKFKLPIFMVTALLNLKSKTPPALIASRKDTWQTRTAVQNSQSQSQKKGEASQNRNNKIVNNSDSNIFSTSSATVQKGVSFANALKNDKQMAPPLDKSEPAQSKPEATPTPKENRNRNNPKTTESEKLRFHGRDTRAKNSLLTTHLS
ncbi:hypothetical protein TNCV_4712411 [Trichonephila clavipes]|nr:hypothetical protein TNCV_4712411 [Trichonephila clavipes]